MLKSRGMDVVWSVQFLIALVCFMAPTIVAARFVYRRVLSLGRRRQRIERKRVQAQVQAAPRQAAVLAVCAPSPVRWASIHQPIENLRQRLIEFRASLQHSRAAL